VAAVPCRDRAGHAYEVTLRLALDRQPFAVVGERCGHRLAALAAQVQAAIADPAQARAWPDPDDRFPVPGDAVRGPPYAFQPGEREYFTLRSKERSDPPGGGEVRCVLRSSARWHQGTPAAGQAIAEAGRASTGPGYWQLSRRAVVEAWGERGTGVRAVLTSAELVMFLDTVLSEPDESAPAGSATDDSAPAGSPAAEAPAWYLPGRLGWPVWRQRERVPDGSARSRLPALRAAARSVALAVGNPQARRSDVRR